MILERKRGGADRKTREMGIHIRLAVVHRNYRKLKTQPPQLASMEPPQFVLPAQTGVVYCAHFYGVIFLSYFYVWVLTPFGRFRGLMVFRLLYILKVCPRAAKRSYGHNIVVSLNGLTWAEYCHIWLTRRKTIIFIVVAMDATNCLLFRLRFFLHLLFRRFGVTT